VEHSQYNKSDPVVALLVPIGMLAILAYLERGGRGRAVLAGAVIGLAVAAKYNGAPLVVPFVLAVALRHRSRMLAEPDVYLGGVAAAATFLACCPFLLADFPRFLDEAGTVVRNYAVVGIEGQGADTDNWAYHGRYIADQVVGVLGLLAALGGLALALFRLDGRTAVFLSFPILYFSYYSAQRVRFPSNMVPVYPFLAILAAYAVVEAGRALGRRWPRPRTVAPAVAAAVLLLLAPLLWGSVAHNRAVTLPDTGGAAREWISGHLPPGTALAVELHGPVLDASRYRVVRESRIVNRGVRSYRADGVEYLVVSSYTYDRFAPDHRQSRDYQELFAICPLVQEFAPVPGARFGPTIRILQVPPGPPAPEPTPASPR
jgi:hypothetical protein